MPGTRQRRLFTRLFLVYLGLIYLTLPILPLVVDRLKAIFGSGSILYVTMILVGLPLALSMVNLLRRTSPGEFARKFLPLYLAAVVLLIYLWNNPVEQVHIIEYGLLGYLAFRASGWGTPAGSRRSLLTWTTLTLAAGVADEVIQHFLPNRVFDVRDVVINSICGLLGILAGLALSSIGSRRTI